MLLFKRLTPCFLLLIAMSLILGSSEMARSQAQNTDTRLKQDTQQPANAHLKPQGGAASNQDETAVPIDTEKIDEAGKTLGKKIDAVSARASVKYGLSWINARVLGEISWLKLIICFGLIMIVLAVERSIGRVISSRMEKASQKSEFGWGDLIVDALRGPLTIFIRVYGVYWALSPIWMYLEGPGGISTVHRLAGKAADLGGTVAIFWFIYRFIFSIDFKIRKWIGSYDSGIHDMLVPLLSKTVRVFVLLVGGMLVIQNMTGIELGPLVASLGIGGLAIALAGKDSIANFLGSLTILMDKPFRVGERIIIDKHDGFVEWVGFRSTRVRTLTGNLVSIPNEKIVNSTLENIGRRSYLRWNTDLGLTCETPPEKVESAVRIVEELLMEHEGMSSNYPPRVHFNGFKDWSLNLSIYAWYFPPAATPDRGPGQALQAGLSSAGGPGSQAPDFWRFQSWVQKTCLEIMHRFREEGIEMAYPTQAVYQVEGAKAETQPGRGQKRITAETSRGPNGQQRTLKDAIEQTRTARAK